MRNKKKFEFNSDEKRNMITSIQNYFEKERDEEIGNLAADMILDFISNEIGVYFYNKGLKDAHDYIVDKAEDIYGLEKDVDGR